MARYETKPTAVEAVQWFKPGDHPDVVEIDGGYRLQHSSDARVAPGDWIVTFIGGETFAVVNDVFADRFHPVVEPAEFVYTNHRGETATRRVVPRTWRFGASEFHPDPQLLLEGFCLDRQADRTFAAAGIATAGPDGPSASADWWRSRAIQTDHDVRQTLGRALGFPRYADDQVNFPGATEADGVCTGPHVPETLASMAGEEIGRLNADLTKVRATVRSVLVELDFVADALTGGVAFRRWRDRLMTALDQGRDV